MQITLYCANKFSIDLDLHKYYKPVHIHTCTIQMMNKTTDALPRPSSEIACGLSSTSIAPNECWLASPRGDRATTPGHTRALATLRTTSLSIYTHGKHLAQNDINGTFTQIFIFKIC